VKARLALGCGIAAAVSFITAPTASAAPKTGPTYMFTCPGLGTFEIIDAPGRHPFTPAFSSNQVFVPYRLTGTTTDDDEVQEFDIIKPAPVPASAITCLFEGTVGDVVIEGTAVVVIRGRS
jgi:hypothetical protein